MIHGDGGSSLYLCPAGGLEADWHRDGRQVVLVLHGLTSEEVLDEMAGGEMPTPRPPSRSGRSAGGVVVPSTETRSMVPGRARWAETRERTDAEQSEARRSGITSVWAAWSHRLGAIMNNLWLHMVAG
jgi:hypothetical protein